LGCVCANARDDVIQENVLSYRDEYVKECVQIPFK